MGIKLNIGVISRENSEDCHYAIPENRAQDRNSLKISQSSVGRPRGGLAHPKHRLPVRPAAAEPLRASDAPADQPRLAGNCASLRGLMEEVYRLFDRRCRMATALAKLDSSSGTVTAVRPAAEGAQEAPPWRRGWSKGRGVFGPAAAGCCDVERGGAWQPSLPQDLQKTVYRVWTQRAIEGRLCPTPPRGSSTPKAWGPDDQDPAQGGGRHDAIARYPC